MGLRTSSRGFNQSPIDTELWLIHPVRPHTVARGHSPSPHPTEFCFCFVIPSPRFTNSLFFNATYRADHVVTNIPPPLVLTLPPLSSHVVNHSQSKHNGRQDASQRQGAPQDGREYLPPFRCKQQQHVCALLCPPCLEMPMTNNISAQLGQPAA